jgi:hypothetical protein
MKMYWLYDLPIWIFGTLTLAVFVVFGLAGLYLTRGWMRRLYNRDHAYNDSSQLHSRNSGGLYHFRITAASLLIPSGSSKVVI